MIHINIRDLGLKNVLITGSKGFVGQRLVKAISSNIKVISREKHPYFQTIICDFEKDIIPINALNGIDTVIHLAGFAHDTRDAHSVRELYQKVNVQATIDLANLSINAKVEKFIFISSVKAGGVATPKKCITEEVQGEPDGIYGKTKREAELKLLDLSKGSNMHVTIIRPALVYGPAVKGNLKLMLSGIKNGWFPPLPDIGNKRSMIHVDDLVRAILFVTKDSRTNGEVFIATDGCPYSSSEIYDSLSKVAGKSARKWRVPKLFFDIASQLSPVIKYKINKLLGDECYSSEKLEKLGFKPLRKLKEINETFF